MNTYKRDCAVSVLASLSEQKIDEFIRLFADEGMLTRMECDQLAYDPNAKRYTNFKEFMKDMEDEMENEEDV